MAAALGMILGASARALGEHAQEKRQLEHEANQHFLQTIDDHLKAHPEDAATPEFAKYGKKIYGEHWEPMQQILGFAAQQKQKEESQFAQLMGGGSQQSPIKQPQTMEEWQDFHDKLITGRAHFADNPAMLKAVDDHIASAEKAMEQLRTEKGQTERQKAGFQQQETLRQEHHSDAETLLKDRIGAETGKEKEMIGLRESANIDEARKKKELGLTGTGDKPAKPIDPMVAANRAGVVLSKLQKQADTQFKDKEPSSWWDRDAHRKWTADKEAWLAKQAHAAGVNPETGLPLSMSPAADSAAPTQSKSGKKMVKDPKSPSGWSYAD
jgi:hypothetical protein